MAVTDTEKLIRIAADFPALRRNGSVESSKPAVQSVGGERRRGARQLPRGDGRRTRAAGRCPARPPRPGDGLSRQSRHRARRRSARRAAILANRRAVPPPCCAPCIRPRICGRVIGSLHAAGQIRQRPLQLLHVLGHLRVGVEVGLERGQRLRAALLLRDRRQRLVGLRMRVQVVTRRGGHRADGLGDLAGRARIRRGGCRRRDGTVTAAIARRLRRRQRTRRTGCDGRSQGSVSWTTPYDLRTSACLANGCDRRQTSPDAVAAKTT